MSDLPLTATLSHTTAPIDQDWLTQRLSQVLLSRIHDGRLTIITPGGLRLSHGNSNGPEGVVVLHNWRALRRLVTRGDIALAEAFIDGDWDSPNLPALIEVAARNMPTLSKTFDATWLQRLRNRVSHRLNANTKRGSKRNIRHHYDLGNAFYRTWLDGGMSYSSGLYASPDQTLDEAQLTKQRRAAELMRTRPGQRVLEIGCGWGGLAEHLIRQAGCHVTGVTLSPAQLEYARQRLDPASADVRLQDYRDVTGRFDRIVSVEMMEAVGESYWPSYFATLRDRLLPGGLAVIQAITIAEDKFEGYRRCTDFIQQYIFPGGMLPTVSEIQRQTEKAGMELLSMETFGDSYARTLAEWRTRFHAAWPDIERLGFDRRFRRMWDYYLAYCEGGFRAATIDVGLYVLAKPA
jgi:cyclopropane-fatty-acyl-phospholipid synthase